MALREIAGDRGAIRSHAIQPMVPPKHCKIDILKTLHAYIYQDCVDVVMLEHRLQRTPTFPISPTIKILTVTRLVLLSLLIKDGKQRLWQTAANVDHPNSTSRSSTPFLYPLNYNKTIYKMIDITRLESKFQIVQLSQLIMHPLLRSRLFNHTDGCKWQFDNFVNMSETICNTNNH